MKWQPDDLVMERHEYDYLAARVRASGGWAEEFGPIVVDDEGNLLDGYKRVQVMRDEGYGHAAPPAYVVNAKHLPDAERRQRYPELRRRLNARHHEVLLDEVEAWLRGQA